MLNQIEQAAESFTRFFRKPSGPISLLNPQRSREGIFSFELQITPKTEYRIEFSRDLKTWELLQETKANLPIEQITHNEAREANVLFYRAATKDQTSNLIAFVVYHLLPGQNLIGISLKSASMTVKDLFGNLPSGSVISSFRPNTFEMVTNKLSHTRWERPLDVVQAGEGILVLNPTDLPLDYGLAGEVGDRTWKLPIPKGNSLRCHLLPLAGTLDEDLRFPASEDDVVNTFDASAQEYKEFKFNNSRWQPASPLIGAGEGFWVSKNNQGIWEFALT